ncbi:Crp/Fnr family transcriptional regulator [Flavivirga aquimarina]|uniref:Crp/Fnr family transcriptional regulator n=1 Tax=Flavivirga aquimarina TaxID=2027862 RepID=A0ABT8WDS9_9FLAO|nr:Crp/Fnr family transcriptional regulator [Flavivirga aquimarina]MDO5971198.1 Crp/Fnr family transcriptional regulator [Flavivirga aquimarina]
MNPYAIFVNSFLNVSEETFNKLANISTYKKFEKGFQIDSSGEVPGKIYLLTSGIVRAYLSSEEGKEFNKSFFMAYSFVGSLTALIKKQPSKLTYETLTECKVYELSFDEITKLCREDITISNLYNKILESIFIKYEERQLEFISMNATERYLKLRRRIPEVDDLIPQYHIASYLSITPVQLSRIRKKIGRN